MPEGRRIRSDNSVINGRNSVYGRSVRIVNRSVQPNTRRTIDGISVVSPVIKPETSIVLVEKKEPPSVIVSPRPIHTNRPALPRQTRSVVLTRQTVRKKPKKRIRHKSQKSRLPILITTMVLVIVAGGSFFAYMGWSTNKKTAAQIEVLAKSTDEENHGDTPSEDEINTDIIAAYTVAPDLPRIIKIPRLQVNARVKRLGVKASGELMAPNNINDAGWYDSSAKPTEDGAVLIDGHVFGSTKPGVFYRLSNLKEGDTVEIERGDGKIITYKVAKTEFVDHDKIDMAKALTSIEPGRPGLNLITYTTRYDVKANKYEQHCIVYTVEQ